MKKRMISKHMSQAPDEKTYVEIAFMRYVNIFDDEQYSHRDIDLGTAVPTKDGVLQEALRINGKKVL